MRKPKRIDTIHQVTLYKLKDFVNLDDIGFADYERVFINKSTQPNFAIFFLLAEEQSVNWYNIFNSIEINLSKFSEDAPKVKHSGFIFITNIDESSYACTGGLGFHALNRECKIEPRFGISIAKKILLPTQLKGLVQKDSSGILNSLDRVFKGSYNPTGDIDNLHRVLTNIRASALPNEKISDSDIEIGRSIKAGDSLNVTGQKDLKELITFINHVDVIWKRDSDNSLEIPELEYINPKHEKELIDNLNDALSNKIMNKENLTDLFIDDMDIGLLTDRVSKYTLKNGRNSIDVLTPEEVFKTIAQQLTNKTNLESISISFEIEDGIYDKKSKSVRNYICGDLEYDSQTYFLISNRWYRANQNFIDKINEQINEILFIDTARINFPEWDDHCTDEDYYIYTLCSQSFTVLHKHLIHPYDDVNKIELCDLLLKKDKDFFWIHIKHASGAALRELFSQGYISAQLFRDEPLFKAKVVNAKMDKTPKHTISKNDESLLLELKGIHNRQIHVTYAIYDDSSNHNVNVKTDMKTLDYFNKTLSLYAKIDLLRRVQDIRSLGFNAAITRIKPYEKI
jgi:uncharacterized protein (TIGR04141 family)